MNKVKTSIMKPEQDFIMKIEATDKSLGLLDWASKNRAFIEEQVLKYSGVLFRNFKSSEEDYGKIVRSLSNEMMSYIGGYGPSRPKFSDGSYFSTTAKETKRVFQHNEQSYFRRMPTKIFLYSVIAAKKGGETPICSNRVVTKKLNQTLLKTLEEKGILYVRNFIDPFTFESCWKGNFETDDKGKVEEFCRLVGAVAEWRPDGILRTRNVAQGTALHPISGEKLFMCQPQQMSWNTNRKGILPPLPKYSADSWDPEVFEREIVNKPADELVASCYYGDGSILDVMTVHEINDVIEKEKFEFPWQAGDLLYLDNMLASHGRNPFEGDRKVMTALADPISLACPISLRADAA